jgi:hypothetical protein
MIESIEFLKQPSLKRLKAELFTYGIRFPEKDFEALRNQNPFNQNRSGLSAGRFIELDRQTVVNIPFWEPFVEFSPFNYQDGQLFKEEEPVDVRIDFVPTPKWLTARLSSGKCAGEIIQLHGKSNLATMVFGCDFQNKTERCIFCSAPSFERRPPMEIEDLVESTALALNESSNYSLSINAGTLKTGGRGLEILIPMIESIRTPFPNLPLMLEIAPPENPDSYRLLADVNSSGPIGLMLNLNFWSDAALNIVEPGKNKVISREEYFRTWEKAIQIFGTGKISSCILCGIEAENYTRQAIDRITEVGVIPEIIMYRPTIGSTLGKIPLDPALFLRLSNYAKQRMMENRITPTQVGCVNCGGCSLTTL